ncbi:hypothetical protein L249_7776 [Ophiocordyceps polyrhachis-furcata BCC 54312]|uniref:CDP-diacylglycerol--glycerol-3-phosphate 3-phosphatidyltransferase n=1 Tax=Ophiocordyceps polyrhachis-furcata BCC 54312 TaxID=1330021 RepID=A0A367LA78_9HYPO|nr:hypothetical protein L249_7776 [Ophiocordyceps polyrhachis-furcata BCC 54312]
MLVCRRAVGCVSRARWPAVSTPSPVRVPRRAYIRPGPGSSSSSSSTGAATMSSSMTGMEGLALVAPELDRLAPGFDLGQDDIRILETPSDFYAALRQGIRKAQRRIFLATLYIGRSEGELVDELREALRRCPQLRLSVLTDALRGTREAPDGPSCASLLAPLVAEFGPARVELRMYHTPNLTGLRRRLVPKRINEGWGLQHMKMYGFDDEVILSGANLSNDYFTHRQDRYHLFSCAPLVQHLAELHRAVCSFSFLVRPSDDRTGFALSWPDDNSAPSPLRDPTGFVRSTTATLRPLLTPPPQQQQPSKQEAPLFASDTRVYVLAQMSQLLRPDSSTELPAVTRVLEKLASPATRGSSWTFTAGYFNPAPELTRLLLDTASTRNTVITAAPEANGFYGSRGVSGLLPGAYVLLARRFLDAIHRAGRDGDVVLKEWRRGTAGQPAGWTYHAKGLWVTMPGDDHPAMTLIGSSNYTHRSYSMDLEVGALVLTRGRQLQRRLADELGWLQEHARVVGHDDFARNDRRVGLNVRIAMGIVRLLGGAL